MKKILALVLALCMVFALCACGSSAPAAPAAAPATEAPAAEAPAAEAPAAEATAVVNADDIADEMTTADGKYQIAFITDVGQLKDKGFNQGTYDGVKAFAAANGMSYKYYQPANGDQATDNDRADAFRAACENGAQAVVCAGFLQGTALAEAAAEYPDVKFIFVDGWALDGLDNVVGICFKEEQCGYLAGYAAVKDGYESLGFCGGGGGTNPACCRYGYGYVQGASAAAAEMGKVVDMKYSWLYGSSFSGSPELQTMATGWYEAGTEVIFVCGGSMFLSVASAASASDGAVIGVDVDQSGDSDTVITSALKGLAASVDWALTHATDGSWDTIGGTAVSLGAADGAVGLPVATWSLTGWTVEEYEAMLQQIVDGSLVIDDNYENLAGTDSLNLTIVE